MKKDKCFAEVTLSNGKKACGIINESEFDYYGCEDCNFYKSKDEEIDPETILLIRLEKSTLESKIKEEKSCLEK